MQIIDTTGQGVALSSRKTVTALSQLATDSQKEPQAA